MTTLIADLRSFSMGADRQVSHKGMRGEVTKIHKTKTYSNVQNFSVLSPDLPVLVGIAGVADYSDFVLEWVKNGMSPAFEPRIASKSNDLECIVLSKDSIYTIESEFCPLKEEAYPYYALGTGMQIAMASLYLGHSLEETLRVCHRFDLYTGNTFDILFL